MTNEKVKIRGLSRIGGGLLGAWGAVVALKGLFDLFWGEPEANLYSPRPWEFVTQEQWLRYAGFELAYGLACLALAWYAWTWGRSLPEVVERPRREPDLKLFQ